MGFRFFWAFFVRTESETTSGRSDGGGGEGRDNVLMIRIKMEFYITT